MILRFSKDLKRQDVYANGNELANVMGADKDEKGKRVFSYNEEKELFVASIKKPVLVTDIYKISKLNPTLRDTVVKLYESPKRVTEYDGVSLSFEQAKYIGAWGPSIDTLLFCRAVNKLSDKLSSAKTFIEIGSGSGFISKFLLEKYANISEATMVDINPSAIKCCKDNIKDKRARFILGDAVKYVKNKKFDLIVCNPPYIPRPQSIDDNPYEGVGLIKYLIDNARILLNPGGRLITNISSLSEDEVLRSVKQAGLKIKKVDKMTVPLKVCNVLNNKDWLKYLVGRGMKKRYKNGYEYYQNLSIVDINP